LLPLLPGVVLEPELPELALLAEVPLLLEELPVLPLLPLAVPVLGAVLEPVEPEPDEALVPELDEPDEAELAGAGALVVVGVDELVLAAGVGSGSYELVTSS